MASYCMNLLLCTIVMASYWMNLLLCTIVVASYWMNLLLCTIMVASYCMYLLLYTIVVASYCMNLLLYTIVVSSFCFLTGIQLPGYISHKWHYPDPNQTLHCAGYDRHGVRLYWFDVNLCLTWIDSITSNCKHSALLFAPQHLNTMGSYNKRESEEKERKTCNCITQM